MTILPILLGNGRMAWVSKCKRFLILLVFIFQVNSIFSEEEILILLSYNHTNYIDILKEIRSNIDIKTSQGYMDAILENESSHLEYLEKVKKNPPSLIIALGTRALKFSAENFQDIPILFSLVHAPRTIDLDGKIACGVSYDVSVKEFFAMVKEIKPNASRVMSLYTSEESEYLAREGDYFHSSFDLSYHRLKLNEPVDFKSVLENLKIIPDMFYVVPDPIYNKENFEELSNFAKKNKIILFTTYRGLSELGATASLSPLNSEVTQKLTLISRDILNKKLECKDGKLWNIQNHEFYLNEDFARKSSVIISDSVLKKSRQSSLLKAGIKLFDSDRLVSAKNVFMAILRDDKSNSVANAYLTRITDRLTGDKKLQFLKMADSELENKKYSQAKIYYKKVLDLNPNQSEALVGLKECLMRESEEIRIQAKTEYQKGKTIEAIKSYLRSIQIYSENLMSKKELTEVRSLHKKDVDTYIANGITEYNVRSYPNAIRSFEDSLLIDPENKKAIEYLQLSRKKQAAVNTMSNCKKNMDKECEISWK